MSLAELSFYSIFNDLMKRNAKFATHMHGLAFHVKDELTFACDFSLENSVDSYLCFWRLYFIYCLTSFFIIDHRLPLCGPLRYGFIYLEKVLSINTY